MIILFGFTLL